MQDSGSSGAPPAKQRDYIEALGDLFTHIATWSYDHRWWVLAASLVLVVGASVLAGRARVDNSFEAFFDKHDPIYAAYLDYRADFGSEELSYIVYTAPERPDGIFDREVMAAIAHLTSELERRVPFVREVTSLANVEYIEGREDGLHVYDLLEEMPDTRAGMMEMREKALSEPLYRGGLISDDGRYGAIMLEMERSSIDPLEELRVDPAAGDDIDNLYPQASYNVVEELLADPRYDAIRFEHVGDVPLNAVYNHIIDAEGIGLPLITCALIGLLLLFFFRRVLGVVGPLVVVVTSVLVATATATLLGWNIDMMFIMVPVLVIAVGVANAVHILAEFRAIHAETGDRREAAIQAISLVGTPCLLTSLTTAAGFASMSLAPIKGIAHFAILGAVGVLAAFVLSLTLLFVFLSFGAQKTTPVTGRDAVARARGGRLLVAWLEWVCRFVVRRRRAILVTAAGVVVFSFAGVAQVRVDSNFLHEFREHEPVRVATEHVDEVMGGVFSMIYVFDSGEPEGAKNVALLREMEGLREAGERQDFLIRKSYAVGDLLKDINQTLHEEDPAYYRLPGTRNETGQYLLLYELAGGEELDDYLSGDFARASLELRCKAEESSVLARAVGGINEYLESNPVENAELSFTGVGALWLQLEDYIVSSQIRGFLLAFSVIAVLLCLIFRSIKIGLIAMVPNLAPVILILGVMGWTGITLDYVRLLIASIAIGISVDDTIHHITRFHIEFRRCGNYVEALTHAFREVGRALVITSVVLIAGFLVFLASTLWSLALFGVLIASTVLVALIADFFVMPALVLTLRPFGPEHAPAPERSVAP